MRAFSTISISTEVKMPSLRSTFAVDTVWICCKWKAPGLRSGFGIESSQRFPRSEVVCKSKVTKSNSSSAGRSVRIKAGRVLATIPKSTIHTSPRFTSGILFLHAIQHQCPFESRLITRLDFFAFRSQFNQSLPHHADFFPAQFRKLIDNIGCAHNKTISRSGQFVSSKS